MVAYNEEKCVNAILSDMLMQTYPKNKTEIVISDNCSTDNTYKILCDFRDAHIGEYKDIKILKNTSKVLSTGLNLCLKNYTGDAIVRVDAHSSIAPDFLEETVACLCGTHTGEPENICGGMRPNYPPDESGKSMLLLAAERSKFGASAATYRNASEHCYVDSIFHAAYRREVIDAVGEFDARLWRTEDNDYNGRAIKKGYRICYEPRIKSGQLIRSTLSAMLSQKYQNGYWIGYTLGINPSCVGIFHFVPAAFLTALIGSFVFSLFGIHIFSFLLLSAYTLTNVLFSLNEIIDSKKRPPHLLLLPVVFFLMHICYGAGTFVGFTKMLKDKKAGT